MVPAIRLRELRSGAPDPRGEYVLYWMNAYRRLDHSHALDRALEHARALGKPLLVMEALRVGYRWASDRHHTFILDDPRPDVRTRVRHAPSPSRTKTSAYETLPRRDSPLRTKTCAPLAS